MSVSYPVFQLHNTGKGTELHHSRMLDGLCCLVHMIIWTSSVQDPHTEQAEEDQIVDMSLIHLSEPFCPLDHVCPKTIIEEEVWVDVPPPLVVNNSPIVWFIFLDDSVVGVLGNLYPFH